MWKLARSPFDNTGRVSFDLGSFDEVSANVSVERFDKPAAEEVTIMRHITRFQPDWCREKFGRFAEQSSQFVRVE